MLASAIVDPLQTLDPVDDVEALLLSLSMARGMDEVMAILRSGARRLVGADGVTFVLRDGDKCHYADEDAITPLWKGQRFPIETCISGWAMMRAEQVVIEDIYADDRIPHAAYRPTFVKSLVMTPVRKDDPVAAIGAYWATNRRPTQDELRTLRSLANGAAVAITNVSLIRSLVTAREEALRAREEAVRAREAIILAMASLAETRDNETGNHVRRTQQLVKVLAEAARERRLYGEELDSGLIDLIHKSAPLHDIGKVGIPDKILLKPGKLDAEEFEVMKTHAEIGRVALENAEKHLGTCTPFFRVAKEIAHTHHERWDGSGYPRGLAGSAIPVSGRLMAIVDVYDALISQRVYKDAMPHAQAIEVIRAERGRHFDPELVDVLMDIAPQFEDISRFMSDMD